MARETMMWNWVKLYKCKDCWIFLPRDRFYKNVYWYDCISNVCKECNNKRSAKWKRENKEKRNAYQKKYAEERLARMEIYGTTEVPKEDKYKYLREQDKKLPNPYELKVEAIETEKKNDVILTPSINEWEPVITKEPPENFTFSSNFARAEKLRQENLAAAEEEKKQFENDEIVIQAAIDKNPDAYTEILNDADLIDAFNNMWSIDTKVSELRKRQEKIDKQKKEKEYNIKKEKMRDLVDATLDDKQKRHFEDKLHSLHEEQQDIFVDRMASLSKASFPVLREEIFDKLLENQTWKASLSV